MSYLPLYHLVLLYPRSQKGEGGILFYLCPSFRLSPSVRPKIFLVTFFSATIDGRNLIFVYRLIFMCYYMSYLPLYYLVLFIETNFYVLSHELSPIIAGIAKCELGSNWMRILSFGIEWIIRVKYRK